MRHRGPLALVRQQRLKLVLLALSPLGSVAQVLDVAAELVALLGVNLVQGLGAYKPLPQPLDLLLRVGLLGRSGGRPRGVLFRSRTGSWTPFFPVLGYTRNSSAGSIR